MDPASEDRERQTFWLSLFSAVGVLAILGIILYLSQGSSQTQMGIGGGPGEVASPSPKVTRFKY